MDDTSQESNLENVYIYYANLSPYFVLCCVFTFFAIFSTWWFSNKDVSQVLHQKTNKDILGTDERKSAKFKSLSKIMVEEETEENMMQHAGLSHNITNDTEAKVLGAHHLLEDHNLLRRYKTARQSAIEKELAAGLSEEQLLKEKEAQASQLAAIFNLLKQQEDQFQIKSMDELQEQMKLYKA